jgi:beta-glucanase (GH16 family)
MKKYTISLLLSAVCFLSVAYAQQPDTIRQNGYTFTKEWTNTFDQQLPSWHVASWTFDDNLCEFGPTGLAFADGQLQLTILPKTAANTGTYPDKPYWAGEYWNATQYLYGRYIIRMKPTTPSGVVTSFFLMNIEWNEDYSQALKWSEIDIEFAGNTHEVQFTLHWIDEAGKKKMDSHTILLSIDAADAFHDWVIEWTPTYIAYYLDEQLLFTFDDPALLSTQARPQEIHMNHWVSKHPSWVGTLDESMLPVTTLYEELTYYKLDQTTTHLVPKTSVPTIGYDTATRQLLLQHYPGSKKEYTIRNIQGKTVQQGHITDHTIPIAPELSTGMYILSIQTPDTHLEKKFIIP